jgi:hypothetical protein
MNIDRRALLTSGVAVSAIASMPGLSMALSSGDDSRIERFVYDTRFARAVEAGRAANAKGVRLSAVDGDLTALWYHDLSLKWKNQPMTLAGVTAEDSLFVLGTLAWDHRMRVVEKTGLGDMQMQARHGIGSMPLYSWVIAPIN